MKMVNIHRKTNKDDGIGKPVAEMPLFVWELSDWLCRRSRPWNLLAGHILMSYEWDYQSGRSWWASLVSGVKLWWGCRKEWKT